MSKFYVSTYCKKHKCYDGFVIKDFKDLVNCLSSLDNNIEFIATNDPDVFKKKSKKKAKKR